MAVYRKIFSVKLDQNCGILDITREVSSIIQQSGLSQGICCVASKGSTGGITTIEYEPGLLKDIPSLMEKLIPSDIGYEHDKTWGDGNGYSHLRSYLLKTSQTIPFDNGTLDLGTWQQIVVLNFDNKVREREIIVQLVGE